MMAPVSPLEVQPHAESPEREVPQREVLRCEACKLVQFRTASDTCRRCKKSLLPEPPKVQPAYISKIENGKAMPTLSSLDRLARALQVDISALLRDAHTRHRDESAVLLTDPFLAEIAKYTAHLTSTQKSIFLNHVRELSQNSNQSRNRRMA